jgi:hypothetical protein
VRPLCLLFVSALAFAPTAPPMLRAVDVRPPPDPVPVQCERRLTLGRLDEIGERLVATGEYRAALVVFSSWEDQSGCGHGADWVAADKPSRIALCHAGLNDHNTAAHVCLRAAHYAYMRNNQFAVFLAQLYREAGQINDLNKLLEAIDCATAENRFAVGDTPEEVRQHLAYDGNGTNLVRYLLATDAKLAPWPAGVPKPKPGSLPKALPKALQ